MLLVYFTHILSIDEIVNSQLIHDLLKTGHSKKRLSIKVEQGRNLAAKDLNGFSDPYCILCLFDRNFKILPGTVRRTKIINKTLNPIYQDEKFLFDIPENCTGFGLECWDHDSLTRDDFMGKIIIDINTIPKNVPLSHWFPLHNTKKHCKDLISGEILLSLVSENEENAKSILTESTKKFITKERIVERKKLREEAEKK